MTTDTDLIGRKFAELVDDTKTLYEYFGMAMAKEFILALKKSRSEYDEIKNVLPEDMLSSMLSRAEWKNPYAGI